MPGSSVEAATMVIRLARELRTQLDQQFATLDLTSQQAGVLLHVHTGQGSTKQLAELMGTDTAAISRLVDRLVTKGLLTRTPATADRRAIVLELTAAGAALIPALPPGFEAVGARLTSGLKGTEVVAMMESLLANLKTPAL